ncbi:MAG: two-component system sensor histidine kinase ChiS [Phenylobacterium sp.]
MSTQLNLVKINTAYARFFPAEFLKILNHESIVDVWLGDQTQSEMTVLFLDIRGFTSISEKMTPKQNFDFLNEFLSYVIPSIRSHSGFIDKYIGDAVMALFPGEANDAIKASIAILKQVGLFNELRESQNQAPIAIGIGLHTGSLMLGTIGDEKRMDGTVISDAVNLAARLEGLTKTYGASLVVSDKCFNKLPPDHGYHHRSLGKIQVQGKNEVVSVIEIVDGDNDQNIELKKSSLEMFAKALALYYDHDFEEAAYTFRQVLKANPDDQTASLYHHRSATYMVNGVDENWDGTEKMETK